MIKDMDYFRSFDLLSASEAIRKLGDDTTTSECPIDALSRNKLHCGSNVGYGIHGRYFKPAVFHQNS